MKLARYQQNDRHGCGVVDQDTVFGLTGLLREVLGIQVGADNFGLPAAFAALVGLSKDDLYRLREYTSQSGAGSKHAIGSLDSVRLLPPVPKPTKILCVGLNYHDHVEEIGVKVPSRPHVFSKLPSALTGPCDNVRYPSGISNSIDYEAELALVIARRARFVPLSEAADYLLGYMVANDFSARDWQFDNDQLTLGKGFDSFFPTGPWIVTRDETEPIEDRHIRCWINDELRQETTLGNMIFSVPEIVSMLSTICTLEPGDIIATGTPAGVGFGHVPPNFLRPGDTVITEVEGIGRLENVVSVHKRNERQQTKE